MPKYIYCDYDLDFDELVRSIRKQFKMRELEEIDFEKLYAYATLVDAYCDSEEAVTTFVSCVQDHGCGKKAIATVIAGAFCFLPWEVAKGFYYEIGVTLDES